MTFSQHLLAAFEAVASHGSVGRAALVLNATQPTVSRHIQTLERRLGQRLFERHSQGMHLTPAGADLLPRARLLLHEMELAHEVMDAHRGLRRGAVRVGGAASVAEFVLPAIVARLAERAPDLRTEVLVGSEDRLGHALANREIDLMFAVAPPEDVEAVPVGAHDFADRCVVFHSGDHPRLREGAVSAARLLQERWALPPPLATPRRQFETLVRGAGFDPPSIALETDSVDVILAVVSRSALLGWLPEPILRKAAQRDNLRIVDLPALELRRTFRVYRRARGFFPPTAKAFIDAMADVARGATDRPGAEPVSRRGGAGRPARL